RRVARGDAWNQRRALSNHVVRRALELRRGGPERRTRRPPMARTGCPRRTEDHRRPAGGHPVGPPPDRRLTRTPARARHLPCFLRIEKAYRAGPCPSIFWPLLLFS